MGDFSTTLRVLPISALAVAIGAICAFVALALLRLIGLFTNLFYYGHWGSALVSPAGNHLGWYSVLVPVGGGLIVGLMARYGSERIRGHGIPEAIEAILINGSRVEPKVALLKPLSSAISIGSGGPFGAEGPIIMTVEVFPHEPLRSVVYRMAEKQITRVPVIEPGTRKFVGLVALEDLLKARSRHLEEEKRRERVLDLRFFLPRGGAPEREEAGEQTETPVET